MVRDAKVVMVKEEKDVLAGLVMVEVKDILVDRVKVRDIEMGMVLVVLVLKDQDIKEALVLKDQDIKEALVKKGDMVMVGDIKMGMVLEEEEEEEEDMTNMVMVVVDITHIKETMMPCCQGYVVIILANKRALCI